MLYFGVYTSCKCSGEADYIMDHPKCPGVCKGS